MEWSVRFKLTNIILSGFEFQRDDTLQLHPN